MRVKIVSDGTVGGTKVCNAETGETIDGVTEIEWGIRVGGVAVAKFTVIGKPAELIGTVEEPHG